MKKAAIETVIFDLDGTLIDTEPAAAEAIHASFTSWEIPISSEDAGYITGRTWESAFQYLFSKYRLPVPPQEACETILRRYREALHRNIVVVPGSVEAVKKLSIQYGLGLVSGSNRSEILFALTQLGILELFQVILGAEDYPRSKPAPDGYAKALEMLRARPDRSVIFEDSLAGITSAHACGAWVVAVTGTNHFNQDISLAHERVPDLRGIDAKWIEKFGSRVIPE